MGRDETKQPATFHRLLGGHVEFGERSADAVVREISEELNAGLAEVTLLGVIENVYSYAGTPGHEIVVVYAATVAEGWFRMREAGSTTAGPSGSSGGRSTFRRISRSTPT